MLYIVHQKFWLLISMGIIAVRLVSVKLVKIYWLEKPGWIGLNQFADSSEKLLIYFQSQKYDMVKKK